MDNRQFSRRSVSLGVILCVLLFSIGAVLYDAQVVNGAYWAERSKTKITATETVDAGRGQILDR